MTESAHAQPPTVSDEICTAVCQAAASYPVARMVVVFDPVSNTTVLATLDSGRICYWSLLAPMSLRGTEEFLEGGGGSYTATSPF